MVNRLPDHQRGVGPRRNPGRYPWGTLSPALADALGLLGDDLYVHLDEADSLAQKNAEWSANDMLAARELIGDLVLVIRGLLIEHERQASGDCQICTSAWPCPVVTTTPLALLFPNSTAALSKVDRTALLPSSGG